MYLRIKEEREELPLHGHACRYGGHALEENLIGIRASAVFEDIDDNPAAGSVRAVFIGAMYHQWMVEDRLTGLQGGRDRVEGCFLRWCQKGF